MRKFYFLIVVFLIIGCDQEEPAPPVLEFELRDEIGWINNDGWDIQENIMFMNNSENATQFVWSFGDGDSSYVREPFHKYEKPGEYEVSLSSKNNRGEWITESKKLAVSSRLLHSVYIMETRMDSLPKNLDFVAGEVEPEEFIYYFRFRRSITVDQLPVGSNLGLIGVNLTNQDWFFILYDNEINTYEFNPEDEFVFGASLNPMKVQGHWEKDRTKKYFLIESGQGNDGLLTNNFKIKVIYELVYQGS
ncbi:MAG: PKD domain-containing protein [Cyclobacteriaceae bacterium]